MMPEGLIAVFQALPYILQGSFVTIGIVLGAMGFGLAMGIPLALGQVYGTPPVQVAVRIYVWFFRGVPLLVLLFLFYFGFCSLLDINLSAFTICSKPSIIIPVRS